MGICLIGAMEYRKFAGTGVELTEEADLIKITMNSGKELVCSRADLYVEDLIKLKKLEKLLASGKGSLLEQLIEVRFTVDNLADLGIKPVDDLKKLGITSQDDLMKLGLLVKMT